MASVTGYLSRRGELLVLALAAIGSITLMLVSSARKDAIVRSLNTAALTPVQAAVGSLRSLAQRRAEADSLRAALVRARLDLAALEEARRESERLRAMLGFREASGFDLVGARVIAREAARSGSGYKIDRGTRDGVREGLAVVAPDGLVGKVVLVEPHAAWVRPVITHGCRVSTRLVRTRVDGVLDWSPSKGLHLTFVPLRAEAAVGDTVLTSGLGGVFPRGIRVGEVKGVEPVPSEGALRLLIRPAVDFSALEDVFVIRGGAPPEPPAGVGQPEEP